MRIKFLFGALLFCGAVTVQSQNLLVNGGFDDENVSFISHNGDDNVPQYIPGWDKRAEYLATGEMVANDLNNANMNIWNIYPQLITNMWEEEWQQNEANLYWLRVKRYPWNGWFDDGPNQTVQTPGQYYDLKFWYRTNKGTVSNGNAVSYFVRIKESCVDNEATTDKVEYNSVIWTETLPVTGAGVWAYAEFNNIDLASFDCVALQPGLNSNGWGQSSSCSDVYIDFDDMMFGPAGTLSVGNISLSNIAVKKVGSQMFVGGLTNGATVQLYDVTGKKVVSGKSVNETCTLSVAGCPKGVYILKAGGQTQKVIL